jgi:hypothetical protein
MILTFTQQRFRDFKKVNECYKKKKNMVFEIKILTLSPNDKFLLK